MPKGTQKVPRLDARLGLPICLWLELAICILVPQVMGLSEAGGLDTLGTGGLSWAVHLDSLEGERKEESLTQQADAVAQAAGLVNAGRIGELQGHYLLVQPAGHRPAMEVEAMRQQAEAVLARHEAVRWHSEQRLLKRAKRSIHFNDPKYPQQWHLVSTAQGDRACSNLLLTEALSHCLCFTEGDTSVDWEYSLLLAHAFPFCCEEQGSAEGECTHCS